MRLGLDFHRHRRRPRRLCARARHRQLLLESLERRLPLSGVAGYDQISPAWFRSAEPAEFIGGSPAFAAPASRWIVRLDEEMTARVGDSAQAWQAFQTPTVLAAGATPPWLEFRVIEGLGLPGQILVESTAATDQAAADLAALPHIASYESDRETGGATSCTVPCDPQYVNQYALNNTGQTGGKSDADIDAPEAWQFIQAGDPNRPVGSRGVVVAVVDSGIDYTHPDLYSNIWINQAEIPASRKQTLIDTDGDGLFTFFDLNDARNKGPFKITDLSGDGRIDAADILAPMQVDSAGHDLGGGGWADGIAEDGDTAHKDDLVGWNFVTNTNNPFDDNGHGTHVAGIIGALGNNGIGVTGINWQVSLMPLKILDQSLKTTYTDAIKAYNYMTMANTRATNRANIVVSNDSFGFPGGLNAGFQQAVELAGKNGILTVAAAGNANGLGSGINTDETPFYPASLPGDDIIAVAATDHNDELAPFSSFGRTSVDIAAPGVAIVSTLPGNKYGQENGTSMAAPQVSGVAALIYAQHLEATPQEVRQAILDGSDKRPPLSRKLFSGARLNAVGALRAPVFAPKATLISAPNITPQAADRSHVTITVQYRDDGQIDQASFTPTNVLVRRVGFSSDVGAVSVAAIRPVTPLPTGAHSAYEVDYTITPDTGFTAADAGDYAVSVVANQVVDDDGLAAGAQSLGKFQVTLTDPIVLIVNTTDDILNPWHNDAKPLDVNGDAIVTPIDAILIHNFVASSGPAVVPTNAAFGPPFYDVNNDGLVNSIDEAAVQNALSSGNQDYSPARVSLRGAVIAANHRSQKTTIILPDGTYLLKLAEPSSSTDVEGRAGDLDILSNIEIRGTGVNLTTIDGNIAQRAFHLIRASEHPAGTPTAPSSLTLSSLSIVNGVAPDSGGAILVEGDVDEGSTLLIDHCSLHRNTSQFRGGAIASMDAANNVTIEATTLDQNSTLGVFGSDYGGGAIFNRGNLTVSESTISNNIANGGQLQRGGGGGVLHVGPGFYRLVNSTISSNTAAQSVGGGLTIEGPASIESSTITQNHAPRGLGGGLYGDSGLNVSSAPGYAVATEGKQYSGTSYAVVGAPLAPVRNAINAGAVFVFVITTTDVFHLSDVTQGVQIENPTPEPTDLFGYSVAIDKGIIVVGAPLDNTKAVSAGAAYVFDAATGKLLHTLTSPSAAEDDHFGVSVAISGDNIVVGASDAAGKGAAFLFSASSGQVLATLHDTQPSSDARFGFSVAISDQIVLVGAPGDGTGGESAGAALQYQLGTPPTLTARWYSPFAGDKFGSSVAVSPKKDFIAVGAPDNDTGAEDSGAVYILNAQGTAVIRTLTNPTPGKGDEFGRAVATDGSDVMVGAPFADDGASDGGAAYLFNTTSGALDGTRTGSSTGEELGLSLSNSLDSLVGSPGTGKATFYEYQFALQHFDLQPVVGVTVQNSIIGDNFSNPTIGNLLTPNIGGSIWDNGGNLLSDFSHFNSRSLNALPPGLGPLQDNGGPTLTHEPLSNSSAVASPYFFNNPTPPRPPTDQRGQARPYNIPDFDLIATVGAVERYPTISGDLFVDANGDGVRQARESGIAGQTIYIDVNENGRLDPGEPQSRTDESGAYKLPNLGYGPVLVSVVAQSGIVTNIPKAIARNPSSTFRKLVDLSTSRPGGGAFTGFQPPVIGKDTIVFADASANGALYSRTSGGALSAVAIPGQSISSNIVLHPIKSYDFDGKTAVASAGNANGSTDQIVIAPLGNHVVLVSGFTGTPTGEVSIGSGVVAFHTLSPDSIYLSSLDPGSTSAGAVQAVLADGVTEIPGNSYSLIYDALFTPRIDASKTDVAFTAKASGRFPGMHVGIAGSGTGIEDVLGSVTSITGIRVLAADRDEVLISTLDNTGKEGLRVVRRGYIQFEETPIANSTTAVPGGVGTFQGLYSAVGAMSNRSIVFGASDSAGEYAIYLAEDDSHIRKVISTADTLDGKGIRRLQLADGHTLDENRLVFLVEFDDSSQAIYVDELTSIPGYRALVTNPQRDIGINFPVNVEPAEIHGIVFHDLDRNGTNDEDEPPLPQRIVYIDANNNGKLDADEPQTPTDDAGSYYFDNLEPLKTYTIAAVPVAGFDQTSPLGNSGTWFVTPGPGEIVTGKNFGSAESTTGGGAGASSKLTGSIFISANGDGTLAPNAALAAGFFDNVTVYLDKNGNGKLDLTNNNPRCDLTLPDCEPFTYPDENGQYVFSGLDNSDAEVRVIYGKLMSQLSPQVGNTFTPGTPVSLGVKPEGAAAGDFDHQNGNDLAVAMSNTNEVWILRNTGSGALTVFQKLATGTNPTNTAVADLNNDGWPDLVVSNAYSNDISIFVNQRNPAAPFTTPIRYATQTTLPAMGVPAGITIGQFNSDTFLDIAVANSYANEVAVFLNDTTAQNPQNVKFHLVPTLPAVGKKPLSIVSGHFTGGPNVDLAVANFGNGTLASSTVTILQGNGQGTFTPFRTLQVGTGPTAIAAGLLNDDSFTDLVTTNYAANTVTVLFGKAGGAFNAQDLPAGLGPSSVVVADIDNDGDQDIAVSNGNSSTAQSHVLVLRNQGGGTFSAAEPAGSAVFTADAAFSLVAADFDGQPGNDLALVNPIRASGAGNENGRVSLLTNQVQSDGSHHVALSIPQDVNNLDFVLSFPWHNVLNIRDVDGDSVVTATDTVLVLNYLNSRSAGPGRVTMPRPKNTEPYGLLDVDNDGYVTASDTIQIINFLNSRHVPPAQGEAEGEGEVAAIFNAESAEPPLAATAAALDALFAGDMAELTAFGAPRRAEYKLDMEGSLLQFARENYNTLVVLAGVSLLGASCGIIGAFAVLRKRALTGDALAHASLPGLCLAFLILRERNLAFMLLGALASGVAGIAIISALGRWTRVRDDASIGIVLSVFFGLGIVLLKIIQNLPTVGSKAGLDSYILGKTAGMLRGDVYGIAAASLLCLGVIVVLYKEFQAVSFDQDFARSLGWPVYGIDLALMSLVAAAVVIGLPSVGVVLVSALLIMPGAAARFWTDRLGPLLILAGSLGFGIGLVGTFLSATFSQLPAGPIIVLTGTAVFLASMLLGFRRGAIARLLQHRRFQQELAAMRAADNGPPPEFLP